MIWAAAALLLNFASGPATIFGNKLVFSQAGFHFPILLTFTHYVTTWLTIRAMGAVGVYAPVSGIDRNQDRRARIALIVCWSLYNICSNLSLQKNSVALYQMAKLLMTPLAVLWDFLLYGKLPSLFQMGLLCAAVFGVGLYTASGAELTMAGTTFALCGVCLAIVQKGLTTHLQQHVNVKINPLQLLDLCMPGMALITIVVSVLVEDQGKVAQYDFSLAHIGALFASGVCGTFANVSSTWVLGLTSPIAHILLGQLKTIMVLLGGYLFFDSRPSVRSVAGAALALSAITAYTWSKLPPTSGAAAGKGISGSGRNRDRDDEGSSGQIEMGEGCSIVGRPS